MANVCVHAYVRVCTHGMHAYAHGSGAKEASEMIFVQYIFVLPALTAVLAAALMLFVHA